MKLASRTHLCAIGSSLSGCCPVKVVQSIRIHNSQPARVQPVFLWDLHGSIFKDYFQYCGPINKQHCCDLLDRLDIYIKIKTNCQAKGFSVCFHRFIKHITGQQLIFSKNIRFCLQYLQWLGKNIFSNLILIENFIHLWSPRQVI